MIKFHQFVLVATILVTLPASASSPTKTETIAPGVTASFFLRPSASAKVQPDVAIKMAVGEAKKQYAQLGRKTVDELLVKILDAYHFNSKEVRSGYLVDRMTGALKSQGFTNFMVTLTGEGEIARTVGRDGSHYWRLNIPDPNGSKRELCRVSLGTSSVATANVRDLRGIFLRAGKKKLDPPTDLRSVTVITKNATIAMGLASSALLMGNEKARSMFSPLLKEGFGVILEDRNGKIKTMGDVTAACFEE